ncbi:MAG: helicase-exonuclease AddAB subunit AddB [Peptococcaceae bacterium]|nr:helicase-exonuclease AddAB subunit AddB [Peptococcaceae bacterium]
MAVQFIIGPAGSGKSRHILQTIARNLQQEPRKKIIVMVPEQATFTYQYELINEYGLSGVLTLEILSFQRMARNVMQQTGGLACQNLDDLGKLLILRRLLQQNEQQYRFLNQSVNRPGYLMKIGQAFQELKRYQISSQQLEDTLEQSQLPQTLFTSKIQEISSLYSGYEAFLEQDYLDSEDVLDLLLERLEQNNLFCDTDIWIDEFYDFTPQEYAIIGALMKQAANVYIALPADINNPNPGRVSAFHSTEKTRNRLRQIALEQQAAILSDKQMQAARWENADALAFLEEQYFLIGAGQYPSDTEQISLTQGQNRISEVDAAARKIRQLCREKGYRYHEIGIFTRGDQYELLLETVLTDYDIPYFVDHKEAVRQHPMTELLLAAFEIIQSNWSYQSVFRFLKTELLPFEQHDLDLLENYVLQYGIRGSSWYQTKDWCYGKETEEVLAMLNHLRRQIAGPLRKLQIALAEPQSAAQIIGALYEMLDDFTVPERLQAMCREAVEHNLLEAAQVHQQIWDKVIQIFNQMTRILQESLLSADEFAVILHSAFDNLDLGLLPNSLDQVLIGSLSHSRSRGLKAVFVLGLNEGIFPAKGGQDGFFNDLEKQTLRDLGIELSPDSAEQLYDEQFLIYLALTRASEFLCLSYSLSDEEGKALRPSGIVERIRHLYPNLKEQPVQWPPADGQNLLPYLNHPGKAMGLLGSHLSSREVPEQQDIWAELYNWFLRHQIPLFEAVQHSLSHEMQLEQRSLTSTQIYGMPLHLSVSALEKYRQCPYSYFLTYGLRLKERMLYQMEAVDVGSFYHEAIEQFSRYLLEQNISWQSLDEKKTKEIMAMIVDQLAPSMQNEILLSTGRYRYLRRRLQKTLERTALMLMEHGQKGDFVPVALEADFGGSQSKLPRWDIMLQDGSRLTLQGRIDRIEKAERNSSHYLRVIDFKSGTQGLSLLDIYYGLKIQLLTYLQVALEYYEAMLLPGEEVLPAGVLYYFFRNGILGTDGPVSKQQAEQLHFTSMKADGLLIADMHALQLAQRDLSTGGSTLLPVSLLKSAEEYLDDPDGFNHLDNPMEYFRKTNHAVVTREQLELLMKHTKQMITSLGEEIHNGNIAVRPCRIRQFIGCQYCNYQAICQIQTVELEKTVEDLPVLKREEIWARMEQLIQPEQKGGV